MCSEPHIPRQRRSCLIFDVGQNMKSETRGLAEWAIFYTLTLGIAFFCFVFAMAGATSLPSPYSAVTSIIVFGTWIIGIVYFTRRLARSESVQKSAVSLAPIHLLQFVLVLFTIPTFILGSRDDMAVLSTVLLTWEIFGVMFTFSFLLLGVFARKGIPARTWIYAASSIAIVAGSIYLKNQKKEPEPNQSLQTMTTAVTSAASHPPRQLRSCLI
jgi:hypothetical protein